MKKVTKISLWIIGILAVLAGLFVTCADVWVSRYAEKRVRAELEKAQLPYTIDFEHIHVLIMGHFVSVEGVTFAANKAALKNTGLDTLYVHIPRVSVRGIRYLRLLQEKTVDVNGVDVHKMNVHFKATKSKLSVTADSISAGVNDIVYCWADSKFSYNDSVYDLDVHRFQMSVPKSYVRIDAHDIQTEDAGPIKLGRTRLWNSVGRRELASRRREPSTWVDLNLRSVEISPINLFRTNFAAGLNLGQVSLVADRFEAFRDARMQPTRPYVMPQRVLMKMKYPIRIDAIDAQIKKVDVSVLCTDKNLGQLEVKNIMANVCEFNNKPGTTTSIDVSGQLGEGKVNGSFKMHMDKANSFDVYIHGRNVQTHDLAQMTRPLAAIELNCAIDSLLLRYTANHERAVGNVLFAYHGLSGKVYKGDDIPFKIISQNAGALEYFVNHLIPKSNPRAGVKDPLAYKVEYVRKDMQPIPMYLIMPVITGAVETFLPGFNVHKKVNKNDL